LLEASIALILLPYSGPAAIGRASGLFALAGIPTVVIGPGSIEQAHKADEYIAVSQLEACSAFLDRLIAHSRA
jgi:acetylornithine deacetylase